SQAGCSDALFAKRLQMVGVQHELAVAQTAVEIANQMEAACLAHERAHRRSGSGDGEHRAEVLILAVGKNRRAAKRLRRAQCAGSSQDEGKRRLRPRVQWAREAPGQG